MTIKEEFYDKFCAKYIKTNKYFIPEYMADAPEEIIEWVESKVSRVELPVKPANGDIVKIIDRMIKKRREWF